MFRILKDYIYSFIGLVGSITTLVLFFGEFYPTLSADGRLAVIFIATLFSWFFLENLYLKIKWGRERRYAQTVNILADGFSEIHKLYRSKSDVRETIHACSLLCDNLAEAFTVITGTKCNASIKVLSKGEDEAGSLKAKAITFARNRNRERNPKPNKVKHWIDKNTDFNEILENIDSPSGGHFFANSLVFRYGYLNTSFSVYSELPDDKNPILRYWRWPLPYKSTIVVPICPSSEPNSMNLAGFLCVDSLNMFAFKKDYDVSLIRGVADGLFNIISDVHGSQDEIQGPEVSQA
tara:strand:- start:1811 stop:2689 length:879 start_codon:yes stop_codon:yes gene_type:complete